MRVKCWGYNNWNICWQCRKENKKAIIYTNQFAFETMWHLILNWLDWMSSINIHWNSTIQRAILRNWFEMTSLKYNWLNAIQSGTSIFLVFFFFFIFSLSINLNECFGYIWAVYIHLRAKYRSHRIKLNNMNSLPSLRMCMVALAAMNRMEYR